MGKEKFENYMHAFTSIVSMEQIGCEIQSNGEKICQITEEHGWNPSTYFEVHKELLLTMLEMDDVAPQLKQFIKRQLGVIDGLIDFDSSPITSHIIKINNYLKKSNSCVLYPWGPIDHQVYFDLWLHNENDIEVDIYDLGAGRTGETSKNNHYKPIEVNFTSRQEFIDYVNKKNISTAGKDILDKEEFRKEFDEKPVKKYFKNNAEYKKYFDFAYQNACDDAKSSEQKEPTKNEFKKIFAKMPPQDIFGKKYERIFKRAYQKAYYNATIEFYAPIYEDRTACEACADEVAQTTGNCVVKNLLAAIKQDALREYGEDVGEQVFKEFYLGLLKATLIKAIENVKAGTLTQHLPSLQSKVCPLIQKSQEAFVGAKCDEILSNIVQSYRELDRKVAPPSPPKPNPPKQAPPPKYAKTFRSQGSPILWNRSVRSAGKQPALPPLEDNLAAVHLSKQSTSGRR